MPARAQLLGDPVLDVDGAQHELNASKRTALVAYIATHAGDWVARDELTLLLWGDRPETKARRALRQMLHELGDRPLGAALEIEDQRLRFIGECDVAEFRAACERSDWTAALALWNGPLLAGWSLARTPAFDDWLTDSRADLALRRRDALLGRAARLERADDPAAAAELLGEVWRADALEEDALARQLWLLQRAGRQAAASEARAYRAAFEREMGFAVEGELAALLTAAEAGEPLPEPESVAPPQSGPPPLPASATPFVGRAAELTELSALLEDPEARLLTLIGIGGTGKTRLALELGRSVARRGTPVGWASLVAVENPAGVATALTEAWGLAGPNAGRLDALTERIGHDEALLVIDNAEELLEAVRSSVAPLLEACPRTTILVTSRTALDVRAERRVPIGGLATDTARADAASDAAALLLESARRRQPEFSADPGVLDAIAHEVGGLPLALELIGSWSDLLSAEAMLDDVRSGLGALGDNAADGLTDVPARQRGLRVVLDASWARLGERTREAMLALAPCRGGFDLAAAQALGVGRAALRELLSAALLQRSRERFARHPLVARDALERARADEERWGERRAAHGRHYLDRLLAHHRDALARAGRAVIAGLADDVENARQALLWAADYASLDELERALDVLSSLQLAGIPSDASLPETMIAAAERSGDARRIDALRLRYHRAEEGVAAAVLERARKRGDRVLEARAVHALGWREIAGGSGDPDERKGDRELGERYARQAVALRRPLAASGDPEPLTALAASYNNLAIAIAQRGDFRTARRNLLRSAALCRRAGVPEAGTWYLHNLVENGLWTGDYRDALRVNHAVKACLTSDHHPMHHTEAIRMGGWLQLCLGELDDAERSFERSLEVAGELYGDRRERQERMVRGYLSEIAYHRGDLDRALDLNARSLDNPMVDAMRARIRWARDELDLAAETLEGSLRITRAVTTTSGPLIWSWVHGSVLSWLALVRLELGETAPARALVRDALAHARTRRLPPEVARGFVPAAHLCAVAGDRERAARLLGLALHAEPVDFDTRRHAHRTAEVLEIESLEPAPADAHPEALLAEAEALLRSPEISA